MARFYLKPKAENPLRQEAKSVNVGKYVNGEVGQQLAQWMNGLERKGAEGVCVCVHACAHACM